MTAQTGEVARGIRADWAWWAASAGAVGMACWVGGVAMIPPTARLAGGDQNLAVTLAGAAGRLYPAALLAAAGGVLLVAFFGALTRLVPEGRPGWGRLRLALAGCVITQTMVGVGAGFGMVATHAAVSGADAGLVALAWRGLWLMFLASAVPTILFTVAGVLGMRAAGLAPAWVGILGGISALAHLVVMGTVAQAGPFAPDGIVGAIVPLTTVVWILAACAMLPGRVRGTSPAVSSRGGARHVRPARPARSARSARPARRAG